MKNTKKSAKNAPKKMKSQNMSKGAKTAKATATKKMSITKPKAATKATCKVVSKKQTAKKPAAQPNFIKDKDKLRTGDCVCLIRDKYTGKERVADGSVAKVPYKPNASAETKKRFGKNLVYVIHSDSEEVVGFRQKPQSSPKTTAKPQGKRANARAGEFWSVNSKETMGHKGVITKKRKSGKVDVITTTHSKYTKGRKNIKLQENPQKSDKRAAYVVNKVHKVNAKQLGKKQPDMTIKNKTDKAVIRKIKSNAKKKHK